MQVAGRSSKLPSVVIAAITMAACQRGGDTEDIGQGAREFVGRVELILGDDPDASVIEDANGLAASFSPTAPGGVATPITIEFIGQGTFEDAPEGERVPPQENADAVSPEDPEYTSFVGINVATANQFRVTMSRGEVAALAPITDGETPAFEAGPGDFDDDSVVELEAEGEERGKGAAPSIDQSDEHDVGGNQITSDRRSAHGWANNLDTRQRIYGLDSPVSGVQRWQIRFGSPTAGGCSGSLVGPRHVLTAAHCLYKYMSPGVGSYFDKYSVYAGANGTSSLASAFINQSNIPPGQSLWFWVPSQYVAGGTSENDIGILVTPAVLGGNLTGQAGCFDDQCWFGYMNLTEQYFSTLSLWRRGYPLCDPTTSNGTPTGTPRIDEPCQTGTWDPNQTCTAKPCNPLHLHGVDASCTAADFDKPDGSGENQVVHHGCSASAGDSGSSLYQWNTSVNDWVVLSVQVRQECGSTAICPAAPANQLARPMADTRLTTNYAGWITNFRTIYP